MTKFQVSANGTVFGVYEGETQQDARNACAVDAGYSSEADMVARLEQPSELVAEPVARDFNAYWAKVNAGDVNLFGEENTPEQKAEQLEYASRLAANPLAKSHEVVLNQDAYLGDGGNYYASGYLSSENQDDETGPTVKVTWAAVENTEEIDDESSRCNWDKPVSIMHFRLGDITDESSIRQ